MLKLGAVDYTTNVQRNIKSHKESSEKCRNSISLQSQVASADWADVTKTKRISMQAVRAGPELQLYQSGQRNLLIQNSENHTKLTAVLTLQTFQYVKNINQKTTVLNQPIQRKMRHVSFAKILQNMRKILAELRLSFNGTAIRASSGCERSLVALRSGLSRTAIRYAIAGDSIDAKTTFYLLPCLSNCYKLVKFSRISSSILFIFQYAKH